MKIFLFCFYKIWFEPMFLTGSCAVLIRAAPPPFRIFAGGLPRRLRRRNAFGLIQEYCNLCFAYFAPGRNRTYINGLPARLTRSYASGRNRTYIAGLKVQGSA